MTQTTVINNTSSAHQTTDNAFVPKMVSEPVLEAVQNNVLAPAQNEAPERLTLEQELANITNKDAALNDYRPLRQAKLKAIADYDAAKKEYTGKVKDGDLEKDLKSFEADQIKLYQKVVSLPPHEVFTKPSLVSFVQQIAEQYKGREALLNAPKTRTLAQELTERQEKFFKEPFMKAMRADQQENSQIVEKVVMELCNNDRNKPAKGSKFYPTYKAGKTLYALLKADSEVQSMCGTMARLDLIKKESVPSGKGNKPVYSWDQSPKDCLFDSPIAYREDKKVEQEREITF
ncbi:hypothetical protein N8778_02980 [Verrucomicrobia bacterium]|nr:hypothetical protein [Verrucomicrobiota bacterium]